jgi:hypothetical protein
MQHESLSKLSETQQELPTDSTPSTSHLSTNVDAQPRTKHKTATIVTQDLAASEATTQVSKSRVVEGKSELIYKREERCQNQQETNETNRKRMENNCQQLLR